MIFRTKGVNYKGSSAIEVVRNLEREDKDYRYCGGPIRQYLNWSLDQLRSSVPPRDLDLSDRLEDETLALGYLLLLDEYGVVKLCPQLIDRGDRTQTAEAEGALKESNMESLQYIQETTLFDNRLYEDGVSIWRRQISGTLAYECNYLLR